jgi:hypothetical protein
MVDFDPTTTFPADDSTEGFDNVGEGLVTSDYLLRNYLEAARKVADKAILPGPRPQMIHYEAGGHAGADSPQEVLSGVTTNKEWRKEAGRLFIKFRQPLGLPLLDKKRGVPADGEYVIRFSAQAVRRKSRYKDEDLRYNSNEPMRLSISIDSRELGATAHRIIGEYEIPDDEVDRFIGCMDTDRNDSISRDEFPCFRAKPSAFVNQLREHQFYGPSDRHYHDAHVFYGYALFPFFHCFLRGTPRSFLRKQMNPFAFPVVSGLSPFRPIICFYKIIRIIPCFVAPFYIDIGNHILKLMRIRIFHYVGIW